tara:strand:- start:2277 stop:3461 length:1185 start_codon:yes stop_codon:yes gene_type:complete
MNIGRLWDLEYVWIDGSGGIRSKKRVVYPHVNTAIELREIPQWNFDGSSTEQAKGDNSDCLLKPVAMYPNPFPSKAGKVTCSYIVLCETYGTTEVGEANYIRTEKKIPLKTNNRAALVELVESFPKCKPGWRRYGETLLAPWFGFEQEYTLFKDGRPLGFPEEGFPEAQGMYYCGNGSDRAFGRQISDEHLEACLHANLSIKGTNAEVMPGQWEYQIGGNHDGSPFAGFGPLQASDDLWVSRFLLMRVAEKHGVDVSFDPKPIEGDWNGAGCHTNFSTIYTRGGEAYGENSVHPNWQTRPWKKDEMERICIAMSKRTEEHLAVYGDGIERRLTGEHETCSYKDFRWGVADRTASIRIPRFSKGYLEDRRPNANCDPYSVTRVILETIAMEETGH